ncbi:hypothetical protein JCM10207_008133 [Rhodosporidiobolus poonsookiae]
MPPTKPAFFPLAAETEPAVVPAMRRRSVMDPSSSRPSPAYATPRNDGGLSTVVDRRASVFGAADQSSLARRSSLVPATPTSTAFPPLRRSSSIESDDADVLASSPIEDVNDPLLKVTASDLRRSSFLLTSASTAPLVQSRSSGAATPLRITAHTAIALAIFVLFSWGSLLSFKTDLPSASTQLASAALRKTTPIYDEYIKRLHDLKLEELLDLIGREEVAPAGTPVASSQRDGNSRALLRRLATPVEGSDLTLTAEEVSEMQNIRAELLWRNSEKALDTFTVEHAAAASHESTVIFIHGLGQHVPQDGFLPAVFASKFPSTRWVMPQANLHNVSLFHTVTGQQVATPSWFNMASIPYDPTTDHDDEGFFISTRQLNAVIAKERALLIARRRGGGAFPLEGEEATYGTEEERVWASKRIILSGFSQGGAMSLLTGLTHQYELGGLAVFSTFMPIRSYMSKLLYDLKRTSLPVWWGHGTNDPYLLYSDALTCLTLLSPSSLPTTIPDGKGPSDLYLTSPALRLGMTDVTFSTQKWLEHAVNGEELLEVEKFLQRVLPQTSRR